MGTSSLKYWCLEIITGLFILLFVYTAISKLMDFQKFTQILKALPAIGFAGNFFALFLPLAELSTASLLLVPKYRHNGLAASLILIIVFTIYLTCMILFTPDRPCNCGGVIQKMTWNQHLIFNFIFICLAITGIRLQKHQLFIAINRNSRTPV